MGIGLVQRIDNLKVGTKLGLGLGFILLIAVVISAVGMIKFKASISGPTRSISAIKLIPYCTTHALIALYTSSTMTPFICRKTSSLSDKLSSCCKSPKAR